MRDDNGVVNDDRPGAPGGERVPPSRLFWLRAVSKLLSQPIRYLLPVVLFGALGLVAAADQGRDYRASATLDTSDNPLVAASEVSRANNTGFRSSAETTANFINEQLRTDLFATTVAERAGLADALDADLIGTDAIRRQVSAQPNGDSIIVIRANWSDPQTAQNLVQATFDSYRDYVVDTVAADSRAAENFYSLLRDEAIQELGAAEDALYDYIATVPSAIDARSVDQQLTVERLQRALERAETDVAEATNDIETAQLQVARSLSEAGQGVRVIDPPELPAAPSSGLVQAVLLVVMFVLLGFVVAFAALAITTALDSSVKFEADVLAATSATTIITVPFVRHRRSRSDGVQAPDREPSRRRRQRTEALVEAGG